MIQTTLRFKNQGFQPETGETERSHSLGKETKQKFSHYPQHYHGKRLAKGIYHIRVT